MLPELSVLLAVLLGLRALLPTGFDPVTSPLGTVACCLIGLAGIRMTTRRATLAMGEGIPDLVPTAGRVMRIWAVIAWFAALQFFDWGAFVEGNVPRILWIARYVVLFVPAAVLFSFAWSSHRELMIAGMGLEQRARGRVNAIRAGLRRNAIALVPLFIVIAFVDGLWVAGELGIAPLRTASQWLEHMPLITLAIFFGMTLLALPFLPALVCKLVKAKSLEAGELRSMLERGAERIALRYGDIKVWPTKRRMLNAMVMGVTPKSRTILFTDGILDAMPHDELLAVFFHEAGHAKKRHLELYLLLFFCMSTLFYLFHNQLVSLGISPDVLGIVFLALLWFGLLGWVSRRFERDADFYGADHALPELVDDPEPVATEATPDAPGAPSMMRALNRIRQVSGHGVSHRHGSVESRINAIAEYATREEARESHKRLLFGMRALAVLLTIGTVAMVISRLPSETRIARAHILASEADRLADEARQADGDAGQTKWLKAADGWAGAATTLRAEGADLDGEQELRLSLRAADAALRWSEDLANAKRLYVRCLEIISDHEEQSGGQVSTSNALRRFECWIDLGRIAAREQDWTFADRYIKLAERGLQYDLTESHGLDREIRSYLGERKRLLDATVELRQALLDQVNNPGAVDVARKELLALTETTPTGEHWLDLKHDAAAEANAGLSD